MTSHNLFISRKAHANKGRARRFKRRIRNMAWICSMPITESAVCYMFLSARSREKARLAWRASR